MTARRLLGHALVRHRQPLPFGILGGKHFTDSSDPYEIERIDRLLVGQRSLEMGFYVFDDGCKVRTTVATDFLQIYWLQRPRKHPLPTHTRIDVSRIHAQFFHLCNLKETVVA